MNNTNYITVEDHNGDAHSAHIKNCPLCNSIPSVIFKGNNYSKKREVTIKCPQCKLSLTQATMQPGFLKLFEIMYKTWNKRYINEDKQ